MSRARRNQIVADRIVREIERYTAERRVAPTLEEVALELGVSTTVVHRGVSWLESQGRVVAQWVAGRRSPRSVRVVDTGQAALKL